MKRQAQLYNFIDERNSSLESGDYLTQNLSGRWTIIRN